MDRRGHRRPRVERHEVSGAWTPAAAVVGADVGPGRRVRCPRPGWVEQDPMEIWQSVRPRGRRLPGRPSTPARWPRSASPTSASPSSSGTGAAGEPVGPMVSWQDRRTRQPAPTRIAAAGVADDVRADQRAAAGPDVLGPEGELAARHLDSDRVRSRRGELCLGTVDSWLLSRFGGEHVIEVGNASRTQLLDLGTGAVVAGAARDLRRPDERCCRRSSPPTARSPASAGWARSRRRAGPGGARATRTRLCTATASGGPAPVKATYGTGSSVMGLVASRPPEDAVGWARRSPGDGRTRHRSYALEGNIRASGATLAWLARLLGPDPRRGGRAGRRPPAATGVHLVPAFNGLGAPWWDAAAAGLISGLSLGAGPAQLARAALESIALPGRRRGRGGRAGGRRPSDCSPTVAPSANTTLMQLQADVVGVPGGAHRLRRPVRARRRPPRRASRPGCGTTTTLNRRQERRDRFEPLLDEAGRRARTAAWHGSRTGPGLTPSGRTAPTRHNDSERGGKQWRTAATRPACGSSARSSTATPRTATTTHPRRSTSSRRPPRPGWSGIDLNYPWPEADLTPAEVSAALTAVGMTRSASRPSSTTAGSAAARSRARTRRAVAPRLGPRRRSRRRRRSSWPPST